ncbi:FtsX-like permease family protein [Kitasatospora sp. LaBMicrA B282]|uniref:FtsX-like permease family protein n=1 Tax=Kitasatospora sp. LaBMicrA B282 TaxID=3420949 RepID=UPI003D1136BB
MTDRPSGSLGTPSASLGTPGTERPLPRAAQRLTELLLGLRLAVTGGRDARLRTLLTGLGVGFGVAALLLAAAVPGIRAHRDDRLRTQSAPLVSIDPAPLSARSLLLANASTTFHGRDVTGWLVRPDGPDPAPAPGLTRFPGPGELAVSPALASLLRSPGGALLRQRLPGPIVGTIGDAGLLGPDDYAFYLGSATLDADRPGTVRIDHFRAELPPKPTDPLLLLLTVAGLVILLSPVGVFIATAVRFGGETRDRRLAALRLGGADRAGTARIAAGESLAGALLGVASGLGLFLLARQEIGRISLDGLSVFPADVQPQPALAAAALLAVPAVAVLVTLVTMRRIAAEPLGVVRQGARVSRRWWWRLLPPLLGLGLLLSRRDRLAALGETDSLAVLIAGLVLLLVGTAALLPPLVGLVSRALGRTGGAPAWQLAVGRLRFNPETATRPVTGIVVAVAGAIALQTLLGIMAGDRSAPVGPGPRDPSVLIVRLPTAGDRLAQDTQRLRAAPGVADAVGSVSLDAERTDAPSGPGAGFPTGYTIEVADCATLRTLARIDDCTDGDVFATGGGPRTPAAGTVLTGLDRWQGSWQVPAARATVEPLPSPDGFIAPGLLATPGALPTAALARQEARFLVHPVPGTPDAQELIRTDAALLDPQSHVYSPSERAPDPGFSAIRRDLTAGTVVVLALIGAGMLVGLLEQLRERRRTLAVLTAFGTRPRTLALALLWQSVLPVLLGLVVALVTGLALGAVLLTLGHLPVAFAWSQIAVLLGAGAAAVLLVTLLSLPVLWRRRGATELRFE